MKLAVITEMGLEDCEIQDIITDYRKLVKLDEALSCTTDAPFINLISFMEKLFPAFQNDLMNGDLGDKYDNMRKLVVSGMDDEGLMNILLCKE